MEKKEAYIELKQPSLNGEDPVAAYRQIKEELQATRIELKNKENEIEKAFARAHALAMEVEIARVELNQIFNTASDGIWLVDKAFNVLKINDALSALLGKKKSHIINGKCYDLFQGSLCGNSGCALTRVIKGKKSVECDIERPIEGNKRLFILTATPLLGVDGRTMGIVEGFKDITERKQMEFALQSANEELKRLAMVDGLTQVANRRRFDETLNQEWGRMMRKKKPLSLIMIDVDFFKPYNDIYGHHMGDAALRSIAAAIKSGARRSGDMVARYGGEEFAVILPETGAAGAMMIAESIRKAVKKLMIVHAKSEINKYVTLSLGITTVVPASTLSPKVLVEMSDLALYQAKSAGRNRSVLKMLDT